MKSVKSPLAALTLVGGLGTGAALVAHNTNRPLLNKGFTAAAQGTPDVEERVPNFTYADAHEVIKVSNAQGETSTIALLYVEKVKALAKTPITENNEIAIMAGTSIALEKKGFTSAAASEISLRFVEDYEKTSAHKKFGAKFPTGKEENLSPSARLMDQNGTLIALRIKNEDGHPWSNGKVAATCIVNDLSSTFNGEEWVKAFIGIQKDKEPADIKEEYGQEFSQFVRNHEIAHCMGADEARADYIAAKFMLRDHPDKAKATRFLELHAKMRIIHTLWTYKGRGYDSCDLTIQKAIDESKSRKKPLSDAKIWSMAKATKLVDAEMNYWAADIAFKNGDHVIEWARNYDFEVMSALYKIRAADFVRNNQKLTEKTRPYFLTAYKYTQAFHTFHEIFQARSERLRVEAEAREAAEKTRAKTPAASPPVPANR